MGKGCRALLAIASLRCLDCFATCSIIINLTSGGPSFAALFVDPEFLAGFQRFQILASSARGFAHFSFLQPGFFTSRSPLLCGHYITGGVDLDAASSNVLRYSRFRLLADFAVIRASPSSFVLSALFLLHQYFTTLCQRVMKRSIRR